MSRKIVFIILAVTLSFVNLYSQDEDKYLQYPGYVDFSKIFDVLQESSTIEVTITEPLLRLVSAFAADDDENLGDLLGKLKLIKVNSFDITGKNRGRVENIAEELSKSLKKQEWEVIVKVKERDARSYIYLKMDGEKVTGMLVMDLQYDEVTFVNIVGDIAMESIGALSKKFDIHALDSIKYNYRKKR